MAKINYKYTYEEVKNNYHFKLVSKLIKRKYDWVTKVDIDGSTLDEYNVIFLILTVDPEKIKKEFGWDYSWFLKRIFSESDEYIDNRLGNEVYPTISSFMQIDFQDQEFIMDSFNEIIRSVKLNQIVPNDLKLQGNRNFAIDGYKIDPKFVEKMKNEARIKVESQAYRKLLEKISVRIPY